MDAFVGWPPVACCHPLGARLKAYEYDAWIMSRLVFACEQSGLVGALLGGYDGAGSWRVFVEQIRDRDEHMVVQVHEAMHHELQSSTAWGSIVAMSGALAKRGTRRLALMELFDRGVELSTTVHEMYATVMSVSVGRKRWRADPLADNPRYLAYLDRAEALLPVDSGIDEQIRMAAIAAVLRCCMQPRSMAALAADLDFMTVRAGSLGAVGPDDRLSMFEAAGRSSEWRQLLIELSSADSGHQQRMLKEGQPTTPHDMEALAAQWNFETQVVQRRCYDLASSILDAQGSPSILWSELGVVARRIATATGLADPELGHVVEVADDRAPRAGDDVLEFSRQVIDLRPPLPLEIASGDGDTTLATIEAFVVRARTEQEHICALVCPPRVLQKQFVCPQHLPHSQTVLFTRARDDHGNPVARIGVVNSETSIAALQRSIEPRPLLVLTTHFALTDPSVAACVSGVDPVYVLMDLPVGWHIDDWVRQGGTVRYAVATVDAEKELAMIVVSVDHAANFRFFHIGGLLALGSLFERLRQRHDMGSVFYDDAVLRNDVAGLSLAVSHIIYTFRTLDQDGVE
jgi:hypothetical protein